MPTDIQAQTAYDRFVSGVYHPIFFAQLKQAGLAPRNEADARDAAVLSSATTRTALDLAGNPRGRRVRQKSRP